MNHMPKQMLAEPDMKLPRAPRRWRHGAYVLLPLLGAAGLSWVSFHHAPAAMPAPPPPDVPVSPPLARMIDQWDDYVGRFAASKTVEIRPRVSGAVTSIHFRDGE